MRDPQQRSIAGASIPLGPTKRARRQSPDGAAKITYGARRLSPREGVVLRKLVAGMTLSQIAADLELRPTTIGACIDRIVGKTGCGGRKSLVEWALQNGYGPV